MRGGVSQRRDGGLGAEDPRRRGERRHLLVVVLREPGGDRRLVATEREEGLARVLTLIDAGLGAPA